MNETFSGPGYPYRGIFGFFKKSEEIFLSPPLFFS
jgi:hypothetical protein